MAPCDKEIIIEKMRTEISNIKSDITRLDTNQTNMQNAIDKIQSSIDDVKKYVIGSAISIILFLLADKFF